MHFVDRRDKKTEHVQTRKRILILISMIYPLILLLCCNIISAFIVPPMKLMTTKNKNFYHKTLLSSSESNSIPASPLPKPAVLANGFVLYSLFVLKTTGCGLPPGPFGLEGAAEGISYTTIVVIAALKVKNFLVDSVKKEWSIGEILSFTSIGIGVVVAILNLQQYGFLPGFLPNEKCFGIND